MRYMGGKFRQKKAIVEHISEYADPGFTYVEPFCGGMWSAAEVCKCLSPGGVLLNDINESLMLLWEKVLIEGTDWLPTDLEEIERNYCKYKEAQDMSDPLTAWYGVACSFGGKWFGGVARSNGGKSFDPQARSTARKADFLRPYRPTLTTGSYTNMDIPDGAVIYCDPPYEGRTKAHKFEEFDYAEFWQWVRDLLRRCTVLVSCFDCPDDFSTIHEWGDTVVRHHSGNGSDGTCEKLVVYNAD